MLLARVIRVRADEDLTESLFFPSSIDEKLPVDSGAVEPFSSQPAESGQFLPRMKLNLDSYYWGNTQLFPGKNVQ